MKKIFAMVLAGVMIFSMCAFAGERTTTEETIMLEGSEMVLTWEIAGNGYYEFHVYNNTEMSLNVEFYKDSIEKENLMFGQSRRYSGDVSSYSGETPLEDGTYKIRIYSESGGNISGKLYYMLASSYEDIEAVKPHGIDDMSTDTVSDDIRVVVGGEKVNFAVYGPYIENGRTLVPVRGVFEAMGAQVSVNEVTGGVRIDDGENLVLLEVGSNVLEKYDEVIQMDVSVVITNDNQVMLPVRAIAEALGWDVSWDDAAKTVYLSKSN